MKRHILILLAVVMFFSLLVLVTQPAHAGTFTVGVISGDGDIQKGSGASWLAQNTGSSTAVTISGATFSGETYFTSYTSGATGGGGQDVPSYSDANLNALLNDFRYAGTMTATLPVVSGQSYNLQLLFFDPSHPAYGPNHRVMDITVGSDVLSPPLDVIGTTGGTLGAYVNFTFKATGPTETVTLSADLNTVDGNMFLNGFSLLAVPEPSSYVLLGLGGVGLMVVRRRRPRALAHRS